MGQSGLINIGLRCCHQFDVVFYSGKLVFVVHFVVLWNFWWRKMFCFWKWNWSKPKITQRPIM